ncbi:hypothetical protein LAZ67_14002535 [Cordylochernes scorpioides]|uniref:Uncharacterized protein n=1 Tax=Cordylochernes scorpioides TaxID=51811 RepID=A0ABY6L708_9ARAC|nr:hypothetical protein LAZ67_14002535 [Cordylochernes scorpioides]
MPLQSTRLFNDHPFFNNHSFSTTSLFNDELFQPPPFFNDHATLTRQLAFYPVIEFGESRRAHGLFPAAEIKERRTETLTLVTMVAVWCLLLVSLAAPALGRPASSVMPRKGRGSLTPLTARRANMTRRRNITTIAISPVYFFTNFSLRLAFAMTINKAQGRTLATRACVYARTTLSGFFKCANIG